MNDDIVISTELDNEKGKFGRVLASVIVDDVNINELMVEKNHAVAYYGQSKDEIKKSHLINRKELIDSGQFKPVTTE